VPAYRFILSAEGDEEDGLTDDEPAGGRQMQDEGVGR